MAAKPRGNSAGEASPTSPNVRFAMLLAGYFVWFARLFIGHDIVGDVRITGISIRLDYLSVLVIVRGFHLVRVNNVVVFGAGQDIYTALVNVTHAITKDQWRPDKYNDFVK